ncbi:MAG: lipoyl synthase [Bacillota bacterium]|nr:MAG: lipoyl synthase [Planctomycetota bacterium]RUA08533.1 MAG: lipoyl synthase [Bacillota bacterium]
MRSTDEIEDGNGADQTRASGWQRQRLPGWLKMPLAAGAGGHVTATVLKDRALKTICEEARCPNRNHCWSRGTATFLVLGDRCTRSCPFCSVRGGPVGPPDEDEPLKVAEAALELGLEHVVVTSVNRDDLPDQGSGHFVRCIEEIRRLIAGVKVEVLTPDFRGREVDIDRVIEARPDVFNHNIETVPSLYIKTRPGARYRRSLDLLARVAAAADATPDRHRMWVKSGLMLGLGEQQHEVRSLLEDLYCSGVRIVTIGQYLQPDPTSLPVEEYIHPESFEMWREVGESIGFSMVFSAPFVRSSYMADAQVPLS